MEKKDFLDRLRSHIRQQYDMPDLHIDALTYPEPIKQFVEMTKSAGANIVEAKPTDDLNALIAEAYPASKPSKTPTQLPKPATSMARMWALLRVKLGWQRMVVSGYLKS